MPSARWHVTPSLGDLPVTVVTADAGQSDPEDQQFWKRLSKENDRGGRLAGGKAWLGTLSAR
jgi:hypothetical protein